MAEASHERYGLILAVLDPLETAGSIDAPSLNGKRQFAGNARNLLSAADCPTAPLLVRAEAIFGNKGFFATRPRGGGFSRAALFAPAGGVFAGTSLY